MLQEWYQNDELHRDNGKPAVIYPNGSRSWFENGQFIRKIDANGNEYDRDNDVYTW